MVLTTSAPILDLFMKMELNKRIEFESLVKEKKVSHAELDLCGKFS